MFGLCLTCKSSSGNCHCAEKGYDPEYREYDDIKDAIMESIDDEKEKWLEVLRITGRAGDDPERWKKHLITWRNTYAEAERYRLYAQLDDILLYHKVDGETYYKIIEDIKKIL